MSITAYKVEAVGHDRKGEFEEQTDDINGFFEQST